MAARAKKPVEPASEAGAEVQASPPDHDERKASAGSAEAVLASFVKRTDAEQVVPGYFEELEDVPADLDVRGVSYAEFKAFAAELRALLVAIQRQRARNELAVLPPVTKELVIEALLQRQQRECFTLLAQPVVFRRPEAGQLLAKAALLLAVYVAELTAMCQEHRARCSEHECFVMLNRGILSGSAFSLFSFFLRFRAPRERKLAR